MTEELIAEVLAELRKLPEESVRTLLQVLRSDDDPGLRNWSPAIGSLSDEDAAAILRVIEEDCERVDPDAW